MNIQYDAIKYAQQLEAAGVPKAQAEVHAQTLGHVINVCVGAEAGAKLRAELAETEVRLRGEMYSLETRLSSQIQIVEAKILSRLEARIEALESSLRSEMAFLKWMNGLTLALVIGQYVRSWLA
jgi:hypothetical protein